MQKLKPQVGSYSGEPDHEFFRRDVKGDENFRQTDRQKTVALCKQSIMDLSSWKVEDNFAQSRQFKRLYIYSKIIAAPALETILGMFQKKNPLFWGRKEKKDKTLTMIQKIDPG